MGVRLGIHTDTMIKLLCSTLLLSLSSSLPQYPVAVAVEKALPPQPYNYQKAESQDEGGNVQGEYTIALPDGRIQHTKYTADPLNGYIADVTYEGTAVFPPEPAGGYGNAKVVVAAPVYKAGRR